MKKGDLVYVPQNTRITAKFGVETVVPRATIQPHKAIYLNETETNKAISEIFLCGERVLVRKSDLCEWREMNAGQSDNDKRVCPTFFPDQGERQP